MTRRIGLFGGTFDPPHVAHLALARSALRELPLDELRWLPAGQAWQKEHTLTPAADREAMVALVLAAAAEPRFAIDRRELLRSGPSYTIDTVNELRAEQPDTSLFLIIGHDQYAGLHTWRSWQALLGLVVLAVANRPGVAPQVHASVRSVPHRVVPLSMLDISSTDIRRRVARGESIADLVLPEVARYIACRNLYPNDPNDLNDPKEAAAH